jgi:DNA-binding NtrC family response regulator
MKKYILLIDSGNDALEVFENAMSQKEIAPTYNCLLVRNSDMAVKVLNRIIPDFIFMNISANICLHICLSKIHQLEIMYGTPVYLFGDECIHECISSIHHAQIGRYIRKDFNADFLSQLLQHELEMEGSVHIICSN